MFIVCTNVERVGDLIDDRWNPIRVDLSFNAYFRCQLKLKQVTLYSELILPSANPVPSVLEIKWKHHSEVFRFPITYHDTFLPIRVVQLKSCESVNVWLAEVYSQSKFVDLEYRLLGYGTMVHPDLLQFVFEADL